MSIISSAVLQEIGVRLFRFDKLTDVYFELWELMTGRFNEIRCIAWDEVFSAAEADGMLAFMNATIIPVITEFSSVLDITLEQIAAENLNMTEVQERFTQIEYKLMVFGQQLREASGESEED